MTAMTASRGAPVTVQLVALVLDAVAPDRLARFWAHALRWRIGAADAVGVELVPTDATGFRLLLRAGAADKVMQNRIHLDLTTTSAGDQHDTVAELLELGAQHIDIGQDPAETHVVLADPEGNELCVIEPGNRFLAGCPRLGAVNCDGTRDLGRFYSAALGWPLVWDQDEETAIRSPHGTGPKITWSGPPLVPRSPRERLHLHLAPTPGTTAGAALDHLVTLGATRLGAGDACRGAIGLADVDGNRFCVVEAERRGAASPSSRARRARSGAGADQRRGTGEGLTVRADAGGCTTGFSDEGSALRTRPAATLVVMARLCERPGCSSPAEVRYGFDPEQLVVWLDARPPDVRLRSGVLCRRHADAMVVPLGWMLDDRREPVPRLFRSPATAEPEPALRPPRSRRQPDDSEQLALDPDVVAAIPEDVGDVGEVPAVASEPEVPSAPDLATDPPTGEPPLPAAPWPAGLDRTDDLEGQLAARGSLLARAFHGTPRRP